MKKLILMLMVLGTLATTTQAQDYSRNPRNKGNYGRPYTVLTQQQFNRVLQAVRNAPFKDEKPDAFHLAIRDNLMTTAQVAELMNLFAFNDEKLDWAKLAYRYTADKSRFYTLREKLSFISTQREFDEFLLTQNIKRDISYRDVLSRSQYADLKSAIAREPFKDDKKKLFRVAMQNQLITTTQLRDLLGQFTFDDEKLDWAKLAYDYTADVDRFYLLRDMFTFTGSKESLDRFLLSRQ